MHPIVPPGGTFAPPPVVPVYPPGQEPRKVKKMASSPNLTSLKPTAPQVTTLLVTETMPSAQNGNAASLGVIGGEEPTAFDLDTHDRG